MISISSAGRSRPLRSGRAWGRIQINAGAFAHEHTAKTAMFLLKQKLVDAIASDAHDDARRPVDFALAQKTVRRKFPRQYRALFESDFRTFTEDN